MNSPVSLGVSPADASTPTGVLNQWFEALFPKLEPWVAQSVARSTSCCLASQLQLCPPRSPLHNLPPRWFCQPPPCRVSSPPQLPISAPPAGLDECFFFISLVVRLPYSSIFCQFWLFFVFKLCCPSFGCVRRYSVSTYASILAGSLNLEF